MKTIRLNLGCGITPKIGFINIDILDESEIPEGFEYIKADIHKLPFEDNSVDYVEMISVIEHIPFREVVDVLSEVYRIMTPGSSLRLMTDNFDGLALDWLKMRIKGIFNPEDYISVMETIYGNQKHEGEFHKTAFTPIFLQRCLVDSGFGLRSIMIDVITKDSPLPQIGTTPADDTKFMRSEQLYALAIK